jgi:hypothetical protein
LKIRLLGLSIALAGAYLFRSTLKSVVVRWLSQLLENPAKQAGLSCDLGRGIPGWTRVILVGHMSKTLPELVGYPLEGVAWSRFGGFGPGRTYAAFLDPGSPFYQCWYGAYLVFDNEHRRRFGFNPNGTPNPADAILALEADQRLVYHNAGITGHQFAGGRLVQPLGDFECKPVDRCGQTWWRITGQAETWSAYHRRRRPEGKWTFNWTYGAVPPTVDHGVEDLHPLIYSGEFWIRYEPAWQASTALFFIYPHYANQAGQWIDTGTPKLLQMGRRALAGIRFSARA